MKPGSAKPLSTGQQRLLKGVLKPASLLNIWLYRMTAGRLGGRVPGAGPVLLLTTTGRKSGQLRTAPLLYLEDGGAVVVVASQGGLPDDPLWYKNLHAHPDAEVEIRARKRKVRARTASGEEKAALWPKLTAMYPGFDTYQARTQRDIPVVLLTPRDDDS